MLKTQRLKQLVLSLGSVGHHPLVPSVIYGIPAVLQPAHTALPAAPIKKTVQRRHGNITNDPALGIDPTEHVRAVSNPFRCNCRCRVYPGPAGTLDPHL